MIRVNAHQETAAMTTAAKDLLTAATNAETAMTDVVVMSPATGGLDLATDSTGTSVIATVRAGTPTGEKTGVNVAEVLTMTEDVTSTRESHHRPSAGGTTAIQVNNSFKIGRTRVLSPNRTFLMLTFNL